MKFGTQIEINLVILFAVKILYHLTLDIEKILYGLIIINKIMHRNGNLELKLNKD